MTKPHETQKLALIGAIFYTSAFAIQCMMAALSPYIQRTVPGMSEDPNWQITMLLFLMRLCFIPFAVLAFWFSRQKEIKPFHLQLTAISAPICYFGGGLLSLGLNRLSLHLLELKDFAALNTVETYMSFFSFGYLVGFVLLSCAVAIEYYLFQHTPSDGGQIYKQEASL